MPFDMTIFDIIVIILATFRIAIMITEEDGFLSLAFAVRLIGNEVEGLNKFTAWKLSLYADSWELEPTPVGHFGKLMACMYCVSVQAGFFVPIFYLILHNTVFIFFFYALALSGIVIVLNNLRE